MGRPVRTLVPVVMPLDRLIAEGQQRARDSMPLDRKPGLHPAVFVWAGIVGVGWVAFFWWLLG